MPQEEITGQRPKNYSIWHRQKCPNWCHLTDGDWFEQRNQNGVLETIAYIETIQVHNTRDPLLNYPLWPSKKALMLEIKKKMNIPAYIVWHNPECTVFEIMEIEDNKSIRMTEPQYINFIKNLRSQIQLKEWGALP